MPFLQVTLTKDERVVNLHGNKDLFNIPVKLVTCLLHSRKPEAIIKGSFQKDPGHWILSNFE